MPAIRRRALLRATMFGDAGPPARASGPQRERALATLRGLRAAGVLTEVQFEAERLRLLAGE